MDGSLTICRSYSKQDHGSCARISSSSYGRAKGQITSEEREQGQSLKDRPVKVLPYPFYYFIFCDVINYLNGAINQY